MATRTLLLAELRNRLGESVASIWQDAELNGYLDQAIQSLYPHWYIFKTGTTTAGAGPEQTMPTDARNVYYVGVQTPTSHRVRTIRGWHEGDGVAVIPKVNIDTFTLVWSWTEPHTKPSAGGDTLTIPEQAEEVVVLRAQVTALEKVVTSKVKASKYFATQVREGVTENDIVAALDALHASIDARMKDAPGPPERVG